MNGRVIFTDRYDGRSPSWLTSCHGPCEAMGYYPTQDRAEWPEGAEPDTIGYVFVTCPDCRGTARVSALVTLARIPRWLARGVGTLWTLGVRFPREARPPYMTWWQNVLLAFKVAFLADLGIWRP